MAGRPEALKEDGFVVKHFDCCVHGTPRGHKCVWCQAKWETLHGLRKLPPPPPPPKFKWLREIIWDVLHPFGPVAVSPEDEKKIRAMLKTWATGAGITS